MLKLKKNKLVLPVPLNRWYNDLADVDRLREILADESFQRAVATLKELSLPTASVLSPDTTANSNKNIWLAGYCDFVKDLEKLTKQPTTNQTKQIEEWTM